MLFRGTILSFLFLSGVHQVFSASHCVMRGFCGENDYGQATCSYNGSAIALEDEDAIETMKDLCPDVIRGSNLLCCDAEQIEQLKQNLDIADTLGLGRCPSCISNFRKMFCQLTCSPRQSDFLKVTGLTESDEGHLVIDRMLYFMSHSYANGMFDSCKGIRGLTPGTTVLDLMCGAWKSECTAQRWLDFMGSTPANNGFSPFEINFHLVTTDCSIVFEGESFIPMNENTTSCSESPYPGSEACSCQDCEAAANCTMHSIVNETSSE